MGCFKGDTSSSDDEIEKNDGAYAVKMLLLGTGESGKTTILKQMKILHINEFSNEEKRRQIPNIKQNIHESIYDILAHMETIDPPVHLQNPENTEKKQFILNLERKEPAAYSEEYFDNVSELWKDSGVKDAFQRSNEFQLIDSAMHFLNRLEVIRQSDYVPTTQDMLFCRKKTVGIHELQFTVAVPKSKGGGAVNFLVYDVGGQRGERRKWIKVFEGIDAVLFLIAASDFDQKLRKEEDENKNRLEEAFELFDDICYSRYLRDAGMIVFLNKQDLLQKKIESGRKLEKYFPEYVNYDKKTTNEYEKARSFMEDKILQISKKEVVVEEYNVLKGRIDRRTLPPRQIYIHKTIATDTKNIKLVLDSIQEMIIERVLKTGVFVF